MHSLCTLLTQAALAAADPGPLVDAQLERWGSAPWRVLALGKASPRMAGPVFARFQGFATPPSAILVVAPPEHVEGLQRVAPRVARVLPADHPAPTHRNLAAAAAVEAFVSASDEPLLVLLSGGASAYLASPAPPLTIEHVARVASDLMRAGADIRAINTVRKHVETLKGGRLAELARAAGVEVLVLSDVLGDPIDVIASGPFAPDPTTFGEALGILERLGLTGRHPEVVAHLRRGISGLVPETPKPGHPVFANVRHAVLANNARVVDAVADALSRRLGPSSRVETRSLVEGEARAVAGELVRAAADSQGPIGVVWGGEWTVTVDSLFPEGTGGGKGSPASGSSPAGGPSQELALAALEPLAEFRSRTGREATLWVFSTDGIDGPTSAAGACVASSTLERARAFGVNTRRALLAHDSFTFHAALGTAITTGPTGSNLNHVAALVVE